MKLLICLLSFVIVGRGLCQTEPDEYVHPLVVLNGTGDGSYPVGHVQTITATPTLNGSTFLMWITIAGGHNITNATSTTATVKMNGLSTKVAAIYGDAKIWYPDAPEPTSYVQTDPITGVFLPKPATSANDKRLPLKLKAKIETGELEAKHEKSIFKFLAFTLSWFPTDAPWKPEVVEFYTQETGGRLLKRNQHLSLSGNEMDFVADPDNKAIRTLTVWYKPTWGLSDLIQPPPSTAPLKAPRINVSTNFEIVFGDSRIGRNYTTIKSISSSLLPVEFITPAGDPVNAPVDAGTTPASIPDGANEFTFSNATSGVLTMKLKAKMPGISAMPASGQSKFTFEVDTIGSSTFTWDTANPGGKATVSGDFITATATYTGLPQNNTDFGLKKARVKFDGNNAGEEKFEVFYDAKAKNHPGGNSSHPNWFHYYKQNAGGGSYTYDPTPGARSSSISAGGDSSIKIGDYVHSPGGNFITTTKVNGLLKATGWSSTNKYYAHFTGVLAHERQHANGEVTQGSATDQDSDWLATSLETGTSNTHPNDPVSASSGVSTVAGFTDDEVYAGGPVEENGINNADTAKDWANPGTNHKP